MVGSKKSILTSMLAAATWTPMASAFMPEGTVDLVGATYKNGRTVPSPTSNETSLRKQTRNLQQLQQVSPDPSSQEKRCFPKCLEQNLTPEQCAAYIEGELAAAGGHEVGNVNIKVQVPRSPEVFSETYWMLEVPVNVNGQMTRDRNDGQTYYPFLWGGAGATSGPGQAVKNIDCQGLSAGECCVKTREYGQTALGGKDDNGYCLACFAHQEPLIPIFNADLGITEYQEYQYDVTGGTGCIKIELTEAEVAAALLVSENKVKKAITDLEAFVAVLPTSPSTCAGFTILLETLYDAAAVIAPVSAAVGQLACDYCYGADDDKNLVDVTLQSSVITNILNPLKNGISDAGNIVIIYTNAAGEIVDIPKLGGSRADDPYQVDCEDGPDGNGGPAGNEIPNCAPGSGSNNASGQCAPCAAGSYGQGSICLACPPGTISPTGGASQCESCGDRAVSTDSLTCETCAIGTLQVGGTVCEPCPAGTAQQYTNECQPCYVGLYNPLTGQQFCPACPRTKITATVGQIECERCPVGFHAPDKGMSECVKCPEGLVQDERRGKCIAP